jgi:hypothetical protein
MKIFAAILFVMAFLYFILLFLGKKATTRAGKEGKT